MAISKIIYKSSASATPETWMDVTDNTSESANMLSGVVGTKADGTSATGNIASKSSSDLTASVLTVTAPAGHYASNATKTLTDANLTAGNIKKDVEIFGVTGSYEGSGGTLVTKTITTNGTYNASSDNANGYSSVTVNVPQPTVTYTEAPGPNGSTIVNINSTGISNEADVNFIDYDGTLVASRTKAEIDAMTSDSDLPANPTHTGLTAQGWNWTVAQLKTQLTAMPTQKVFVGQNYVTTSGDTEIDVKFADDARTSPYLSCAVNGTITIDWGDSTTASTVTGSSLSTRIDTQHTYATKGEYTITIHADSGSWAFYGDGFHSLLNANASTDAANRIYSICVKAIRMGNNVDIAYCGLNYCYLLEYVTIPSTSTSIGNTAFQCCYSLSSVTVPSGVTDIGTNQFYSCMGLCSISIPSTVTSIKNNAFYQCEKLSYVTIPSSVTSIGSTAFQSCYSLRNFVIPSGITSIKSGTFSYCQSLLSVSIPSTVTTIEGTAFRSCYNLSDISIPSGVTSIGNSAFDSCRKLDSITIPSTVTSIGNSAFSYCYILDSIDIPYGVTSINNSSYSYSYSLASVTIPETITSIGQTAFQSCYSLSSIIIPSSVTTIGSSAFSSCYGMAEYHFKRTTPPTLSDAIVFTNIPSDCVIYVPYSADHSILNAYKTASNWSNYASYMQEEVQ